jgi:hypothetical protein
MDKNLNDGLSELSEYVGHVATSIYRLGLADADTSMGAIEVLSLSIKEAGESIANALNRIADALENN